MQQQLCTILVVSSFHRIVWMLFTSYMALKEMQPVILPLHHQFHQRSLDARSHVHGHEGDAAVGDNLEARKALLF